MFSTLWNLLSLKAKLGISTGLVILCVTIGSTLYYQACKIDSLRADLLTCQIERKNEKAIYDEERLKAKTVIDTQNDRISKYEINATAYSKAVHTKEKALIEARITQQQQLDKELNIDSSADNQLRILTKIMKDFSNEMD